MKLNCPKGEIYSWDTLQGCRTAFGISLKYGRPSPPHLPPQSHAHGLSGGPSVPCFLQALEA